MLLPSQLLVKNDPSSLAVGGRPVMRKGREAAACVGKDGRERMAEGCEESVGNEKSENEGMREGLEGLICCE